MQHPLADYASPDMVRLWTPEWNVVAERRWWLHILRWMRDNTRVYDHVPFFEDRYAAYEAAIENIDLDAIFQRELQIKHDVKARIEEFNHLATIEFYKRHGPAKTYGHLAIPGGFELIHWGMTSADVVDNISLIRMRRALELLVHSDRYFCGEDTPLFQALSGLPLRGIKGPVGTQQDMLDLLRQVELVDELDQYLANEYGFEQVLGSVGQVYPRSIDFSVASRLRAAVQECPNKRPWLTIMAGYLNMIASYSGDQWNEGDVSTSAVRRVALPGIFLAADCALTGVKP